jgi:hypothetical protein
MGEDTGYFLLVNNNDIPYFYSFYEGQNLDYSLTINDKTDTGSLIIPYQISVAFPTFLMTMDYTFEWTIQDDPDLYYVFFEIDDSSYEPVLYKNWQLEGNIREYTISQSLYQNLVNLEEFDMVCVIDAMNYYRDDDFLAFSYKRDYYEQDDYSRSVLRGKRNIKDMIDTVMRGKIKFKERHAEN